MKISIFWHRRDLRLHDNAGLYHALRGDHPVLPLFIFDKVILDDLIDENDARVTFIHDEIERLREELRHLGSAIIVRYGEPLEVWKALLEEYDIGAVYTNRDYEPYALQRDQLVADLLAAQNIAFMTAKDHVIFEGNEVLKKDGDPYVVYTPYSRRWRAKLDTEIRTVTNEEGETEDISYYLQSYPNEKYFENFYPTDVLPAPTLSEMGFERSDVPFPDTMVSRELIKNYSQRRNFPASEGTSRLGVHFRFGTISIRERARRARRLNDTFLNELIWRDFYSQILQHFPRVVTESFREKYDRIPWRNNPTEFELWCQGKTGYPIVDAGMRQLVQSGYMHNRVRMIVASFLTKHLLIDWRWGESFFARFLLDYELASNNGGWQWAAGGGTDASPYFRVFNPEAQQQKFDKQKAYIREWVPEYGTSDYPEPIVEHKFARERAIQTYKTALSGG